MGKKWSRKLIAFLFSLKSSWNFILKQVHRSQTKCLKLPFEFLIFPSFRGSYSLVFDDLKKRHLFGPQVYPRGSLVIALFHHTIPGRFSLLVVTFPGTALTIFLILFMKLNIDKWLKVTEPDFCEKSAVHP